MALESRMKPIGDALIAWWAPQVSSLSLVRFDWSKQMNVQPAYPCNPRTQCPRVALRMFVHEDTYADQLGCSAYLFRYQVSLWLQLQQTVGDDHQELLVAALDTLKNPLLAVDYDLSSLSVTGLVDLRVDQDIPVNTVVYDELNHPLGDPSMRVSTGELNFTLIGRIRDS